MRWPSVEGSLPATPIPLKERPEPALSPAPAVREDANPAQSLLPRMSVAAILDDAMSAFGLPRSPHLPAAWRSLVELVNELDVMVDGREAETQQELLLAVPTAVTASPIEQSPPFDARIARAVGSFRAACLNADVEGACMSDWSHHFELLAFEHSIGHQISDVDSYVVHRSHTGRLLGSMLADLIPLRCRTALFDQMAAWIGDLGACAELIDSFWDLPLDYDCGHSAVEPTSRNRAALARAARAEAPAVLRGIPTSLRTKLLVKVFVMGLNRSGRLNRFRTAD
jgi:hypothetical protein